MKNQIIFILVILIFTISCKIEKSEPKNEISKIRLFSFIISDTLAYGKNLARISKYNRSLKENETSLISIIIENELEDGSTKIDTFSDGSKTPFFGISKYTKGEHKIEIKVEEKLIQSKSLENDSMYIEIKNNYYFYVFDVFVMDEAYKSEMNEILKKQMKIEYAKNPM